VRTPVCPCCGLVLERDHIAARNLLRAGPSWSRGGGPGAEARSPFPVGMASKSSVDLDLSLDLDWDTNGQLGEADRRARVRAALGTVEL
jgi:hypothetical protein